ncbi:hypothetical protein FRB97_006651 [Tulasnella sp. 331]|nr:hypothetical protein FRB97_006651 [Tulasnella sp. 331]
MSNSTADSELLPPQSFLFEWSSGVGLGVRNVDIFQLLSGCAKSPQQPIVSSEAPTRSGGSSNPFVQDPSDPDAKNWTRFAEVEVEVDADVGNAGSSIARSDSKADVKGDQIYHIRHLKWGSRSYELYETVGPAEGAGSSGTDGRKLMEIQQEGKRKRFTVRIPQLPDMFKLRFIRFLHARSL